MEELGSINEYPDSPKVVSNPSPMGRLKQQQLYHTEKLRQVNEAIQALEENPQVNRVLELLAKLR
jgi:hypothetical protein